MRKRILEGIARIGLLAVLPACSAQKQSVTEAVRAVQTGSEMEQQKEKALSVATRNIEIPLLQIDAQSVYNRMINYITPDEELAPNVVSRNRSVYVDYPARSVSVNPKSVNN